MAQDPREQANIRRAVIALGVLLAISTAMWLFRRAAGIPWTGFGTRTLWDWLQLLIIPVVLAIGGFIYNRSEKRLEHQRAEERAQLERQATEDNQREAALQTYLDQMGDLLLKGLRSSEPGSELRDIARVRTLTTVRRLDAARCDIVFRFLHDAGLVSNTPDSIVNLKEADLSYKDLHETYVGPVYLENAKLIKANLTNADLSRANLTGANLLEADLTEANLEGANLSRASLFWAKLIGACLAEADLTEANLGKADLHYAVLPEANLAAADLGLANLFATDLTGADLTGADLGGANLAVSDLEGANLTGATLIEADLSGSTVIRSQLLTCATLRGAILRDGTKVPDDQDFPDGWR